jgi:hypothetical protein
MFILGIAAAAVSACTGGGPSTAADPAWAMGLDQIKATIAVSTGYSADSIELLASQVHIRVSIRDANLAQAEQAAREAAAMAVVAAAEKALASNARFASVEEVSVAIVHPAEGPGRGSHTEDVMDFRKGPNQRFALHTT